MKKIIIFPSDPLFSYVRKGELQPGYYNPLNFFDEIHIIDFSHHEIDSSLIQLLVGKGTLYVHQFAAQTPREVMKQKESIIKAISSLCNEIKPDLIRSYGLLHSSLIASKVSKNLSVPLVISLHTNYDQAGRIALSYGNYKKWFLYHVWKTVYMKEICKQASRIIGVYKFAFKNSVVSRYADKHVLIPNPIDTALFTPQKHSSTKKILWVGRTIPGRNLSLLLSAVKKLSYDLTIIGSGPNDSTLRKQIINLGIESKVVWKSSIQNIGMKNIYNKHDVLVALTEYWEIGKPALEAMACNLPVIHSNLPHIEEELFFPGLILVKNNLSILCRALQSISETQGNITGMKLIQEYNKDWVEKRTVDVYTEVLQT